MKMHDFSFVIHKFNKINKTFILTSSIMPYPDLKYHIQDLFLAFSKNTLTCFKMTYCIIAYIKRKKNKIILFIQNFLQLYSGTTD